MSLNAHVLIDAPVIELDTIDSTNNYAMQLIDADTAQPGLTITAREQTQGKGQRGRVWEAASGDNVLMSIVLAPHQTADQQFAFLTAVAVAVADSLLDVYEHWDIRIKWPNDIIVNDKKAAGILIENVLKGGAWAYSVVGLGLNVLQSEFPSSLPHAISLRMASGKEFGVRDLALQIRERILMYTCQEDMNVLFDRYNQYLYRRSYRQRFVTGETVWNGTVVMVTKDGLLEVQHEDGSLRRYSHGTVTWQW